MLNVIAKTAQTVNTNQNIIYTRQISALWLSERMA